MKTLHSALLSIAILFFAISCTKENSQNPSSEKASEKSGVQTIQIDGSSTVYPLTEAVVEEYQAKNKNVRITVGISGTGGGMKKFTNKEIEIAGASRPIKHVEIEHAKANQVEYVELEVAFDGLSVVVNPENDFVTDLLVSELKEIWKAGSKVKTWKDVRPTWPNEKIVLYGPGTDSGTFDYFVESVLGEEGAIRPDFTASENDHVLVQGVAGDKYSLGYFGYAYYLENKSTLKLVGIDNGEGAVLPSPETVKNGQYKPLSRPIYIYANKASLEKPLIKDFLHFFLNNAAELAPAVGYISLDEETLKLQMEKIN